MTKKFLVFSAILFTSLVVSAQNIQLHYDFGSLMYKNLNNRQRVTASLELFYPDPVGSTYIITDFDFQGDGMMGTFFDIEREFCLSKNRQWNAMIEYTGGLTTGKTKDSYYGNRFQHALLAGFTWDWLSKDMSKMFKVMALYKYTFGQKHRGIPGYHGGQITLAWDLKFAHRYLSFSGFYDIWYDPNADGFVNMTGEPQLWFNFNAIEKMKKVNLSIGTEVKINNNFIWNDLGQHNQFYVIPTIALKWAFL